MYSFIWNLAFSTLSFLMTSAISIFFWMSWLFSLLHCFNWASMTSFLSKRASNSSSFFFSCFEILSKSFVFRLLKMHCHSMQFFKGNWVILPKRIFSPLLLFPGVSFPQVPGIFSSFLLCSWPSAPWFQTSPFTECPFLNWGWSTCSSCSCLAFVSLLKSCLRLSKALCESLYCWFSNHSVNRRRYYSFLEFRQLFLEFEDVSRIVLGDFWFLCLLLQETEQTWESEGTLALIWLWRTSKMRSVSPLSIESFFSISSFKSAYCSSSFISAGVAQWEYVFFFSIAQGFL